MTLDRSCILDFLTGTAAIYELRRLKLLELYCLHDVIQSIAPKRQPDLKPMHDILAQIFEAEEEPALFWLSRFLANKELLYQKNGSEQAL